MTQSQLGHTEGARHSAYSQGIQPYELPAADSHPSYTGSRPLSSAQTYHGPSSDGHSSAAAYARPSQMSGTALPRSDYATVPPVAQHVTYEESSSRLQSPVPASHSLSNRHESLGSPSSPPPLSNEGKTTAAMSSAKQSSSRQDGTASVSRSSRTGASKIIGEPDSLIRKPSRNSTFYIAATTIEAAIVITLVILIFVRIVTEVDNISQDLKTVSVYLAVFVFGCVFQVLIAWDAVRLKNTLQLIGVVIFNVALTVTAALEIHQVEGALDAQDRKEGGFPCPDNPNQLCQARASLFPRVETYLITVTAVCGVAQFVIMFLTAKLWGEFGWVIYQKIGADLKIRNMFLWYQLFIVFLKFAFFFGVGFTVIYLILVAATTDWEYAVTIAAVPIAMVSLFTAGFAVRREWLSLMAISLMLMSAGMVYFVYKLTQVWLPDTRQQYTYVHTTITFISGFAILSLAFTLLIGIVCMFNFHKGLKQAHDAIGIFGGVRRHRERPTEEANVLDLEPNHEAKDGGADKSIVNQRAPNGTTPASPQPTSPHHIQQHPHSPRRDSRPQSHIYSASPINYPQFQQHLNQSSPADAFVQTHQPRPSNTRISLD